MRWGIGSVVVVLLLAGCTTPAPLTEDDPTPTPTAVSLGPVGTVMATGEFDPAEGVTGTVELVVGDGGLTDVRLTGFSSTLDPAATLDLSPFPLDADRTCLDGFGLELPPPAAGDSVTSIGDLSKFGGDDPSFLDGAVIGMHIEADAAASGCGRTILARAPFTWSIPDMRPGLVVVDSGATDGAHGLVARKGDGTPVEYTVAADDTYTAVLSRLGISMDDLLYLNPFRGQAGLIAGEVLNLDRDNRNGPEYKG